MTLGKPLALNNVYSTVQAGSSAIGSASATGINVVSGDGAKFGTPGTDQYVPAVIVDTSTTPETVKEYVYVTARSTDALTVVRAAEESGTYPASTTTIQAGYVIAAVASAAALDLRGDARGLHTKPNGALVETFGRFQGVTSTVHSNASLTLTAIALPKDLVINGIAFLSSTQGQTSPTHWWFGLYDNAFQQLAVTADQTTRVWAAATLEALAVATTAAGAASTFKTTYSGLHYIGFVDVASTRASGHGLSAASGGLVQLTPVLSGVSDTAQTTPPAFPHTATALSSGSTPYYGYVY